MRLEGIKKTVIADLGPCVFMDPGAAINSRFNISRHINGKLTLER
jgi:hypothetical protein